MEKQKTDSVILTERNQYHVRLMRGILHNLADTPLVLKGGTALYLRYGLNWFSEDLDFDSSKNLNLAGRLKVLSVCGIVINDVQIKKDTQIISRYMVNYCIDGSNIAGKLKVEISYRSPVPEDKVTVINGIRFAAVERIIDNKLHAAYDGSKTRAKGRDLFDLDFLAHYHADKFDLGSATRLAHFAQDADKLISQYQQDFETDPFLQDIMDLEQTVLELNEVSSLIYKARLNEYHQAQMQENSSNLP